MRQNTENDVVVVTGASSGLGRAIAHEFARHGARLALLARGREGLEACQRECEDLGAQAIVHQVDVADAQAVEAVAEQVEQALGPINVWVNDAAALVVAYTWDTTPAEFERVTQVSYLGAVYGTLAALKRMKPRNRGAIIQIGSALSDRGVPLLGAYCGAKHALDGLCDSLRTELASVGSNVSVSLVKPSGINTPLWNHVKSRIEERPKPIGQMYQPQVIARAVHFVAYNPRPEITVAYPALKAVYGDMAAPWLADRDLISGGGERERSDLPATRANETGNLWEASPGDPGTRGPYDDQSWNTSPALWANLHRGWLAAGAAALAAAGTAAWLSSRSNGRDGLE